MVSKNPKYIKRKEWALNRLGGICVKCRATDDLEFDHIEPDTMTFRIGGGYLLSSLDRLIPELDKCQLLCHTCHLEKTLAESFRNRCEHGYSGYVNRKCRCDECRLGWAVYFKSKRKSRAMVK